MAVITAIQTLARRTAGTLGRNSWFVRRGRPLYEATLDWLSGGHGIPWMINGETFRIDPRHRHRLGHEYDPPVAALLREGVRPGAVCIDVGANVGVYVLQFARWSGPGGTVIAFEPNPGARAVLERHVALNAIGDQVRVVPAAVGAANGEATLYAISADGMSRLGAPNEALVGPVLPTRVEVMTLDTYCDVHGIVPDWLLIDIEGFEIEALLGARQLIARRYGELGIIVEMHPNVWATAGTNRTRTDEVLAELGLRAVPLSGQRDPLADHGSVRLVYV